MMTSARRIIVVATFLAIAPLSLFAQEWLTGTEWGPQEPNAFLGGFARFAADGTAVIRSVDQGGGWNVTARWTSDGETVTLVFPTDVHRSGAGATVALVYHETTPGTSPFRSRALELTNTAEAQGTLQAYVVEAIERFWAFDSTYAEGDRITIDGVPAVSTGVRHGTVTANLNMRDAPALSGRRVVIYDEIMDETSNRSIPNGSQVMVVGRSLATERVGDAENYWYCVKPPGVGSGFSLRYTDTGAEFEGRLAWVYGEYLDLGAPY